MVSNEKLNEMLGIKTENKIKNSNIANEVVSEFKQSNIHNNDKIVFDQFKRNNSNNIEEQVFSKFKQTNKEQLNTNNNFEEQIVNKFKQTNTEQNNKETFDMNNPKLNVNDLNNVGDKFKNISPLLFIGIVAMIGAGFTPYKFLFTIGFLLIIIAMFDKILTPEKKAILKQKIKNLFKKKEDKNANK